ncbi:MAG: PilT/PilU family type 4a pilus ATPase [bacterium]
MNDSSHNDYVLNASLNLGWITPEQHQAMQEILKHLPNLSLLDLMIEQQTITEEQGEAFRNLLPASKEEEQKIETTEQPPQPPPPSPTAPEENVAAPVEISELPTPQPEPTPEPEPIVPPILSPQPEETPSEKQEEPPQPPAEEIKPDEKQPPAAPPVVIAPPVIAPPVIVSNPNRSFTHLTDYLAESSKIGASDFHIHPTSCPLARVHGILRPLTEDTNPLSSVETEGLLRSFLTPEQIGHIEEKGSLDFGYEIPQVARFRASVVRQRRGWEGVFRVIALQVPTVEQLGLPDIMRVMTRYHNGMILLTGPVGSGKSTTMAALLNLINRERSDHIITLEDPVEYVFPQGSCQISQREVYLHTKSFATSLRSALREDPDVIMIGEMRDLATISLAITAAETGHLVLSTLHTNNVPRTMHRILNVFPVEQQPQIRVMLSESVRGIICQQLIPRADGKGRALALEIMTHNNAVANLIRDGKTFLLPSVMQTSKKEGMCLMDESIYNLFQSGIISAVEAHRRIENKKVFSPQGA